MLTHDQGGAMTMADKIVVMQGGIIEQVGSSHGALPQSTQLLSQVQSGRHE